MAPSCAICPENSIQKQSSAVQCSEWFGQNCFSHIIRALMHLEERTALTFRHERWRAISAGILEGAGTTFLLIIAVRWFQAGATAKALVAGGGSFGLLISPFVVTWVSRLGWTASKASARLAVFGAAL